MLYGDTLKLICAKAIFQKLPPLTSALSIVCPYCWGTRQQAIQTLLAQSSASRLNLRGTLVVNQDGPAQADTGT